VSLCKFRTCTHTHTHAHTHTRTRTHTHTHTHTYTPHICKHMQTFIQTASHTFDICERICGMCVWHMCVCLPYVCMSAICVCVWHTCVCVAYLCVRKCENIYVIRVSICTLPTHECQDRLSLSHCISTPSPHRHTDKQVPSTLINLCDMTQWCE